MKKLDINLLKEDPQEFAKYEELIKVYEIEGEFSKDQDIIDPNSYFLVDETYPYIKKGLVNKCKQALYGRMYGYYAKKVNAELTNLKIEGKENLKGIKAAIITCNHISKVDSFAIKSAIKENFMFVASEHNNWKGPMGDISRNCGYLPLPKNLRLSVMKQFNKSIDYYLSKGKKILIYPEQAMWREYKLPRPLQNGAFHYATKNNVPIIPMFITIEDKPNKLDDQGKMNFGNYTLHILPAIYPKKYATIKENQKYLKLENYRLWKECYEKTYKKPLKYTTKENIWKSKFSEYGENI